MNLKSYSIVTALEILFVSAMPMAAARRLGSPVTGYVNVKAQTPGAALEGEAENSPSTYSPTSPQSLPLPSIPPSPSSDADPSTSGMTASTSRWLFGAKYMQGGNIGDAVQAAQKMIELCPTYDSAGYGTAIVGSSSYYDIVLYVDSKDYNTTATQAGCMVEKLQTDSSLRSRVMGNLLDAAEISIKLDVDESSDNGGDNMITMAHFVRFSDATQRKWLSQRSTIFLATSPLVGGFSASSESTGAGTTPLIKVQSGETQFPDSYLQMWPNDVHFAAVVDFADWAMLAKFERYVGTNPAAPGNHFLPSAASASGRPLSTILETNSIIFKAETF